MIAALAAPAFAMQHRAMAREAAGANDMFYDRWLQRSALTLLALACASVPAYAADKENLLYVFQAKLDGAEPAAGLVQDTAGNLYGTTYDGIHTQGTVFELSPNGSGGWTFQVIYTLSGKLDGALPESQLVFDAKGNLYGTTVTGGSYSQGAVFELSADKAGQWHLSNSYDFSGTYDGGHPTAGVIVDQAGNVYGTTSESSDDSNAGTVFELQPTKSGWIETTLHAFRDGTDGGFPHGSLVMDKNGDLYGVAPAGNDHAPVGLVFQMHNDGTHWHENVLYDFKAHRDGGSPMSNLIFDAAGNLYGTTTISGGGVFKLSPPSDGAKRWAVTPLFQFARTADGQYPFSGLVFDSTGNLYGATSGGGNQTCQNGCGVIYELSPTQSGPWKEHVLKRFTGHKDGADPNSTLIFGPGGALYGTASEGGKGVGVVFSLSKSP